MRIGFFSLLLILLSSLSFGQVSLEWSDITTVHSNNDFGNSRPRIALDYENTPVIIWGKRLNKAVFISRLENGSFLVPKQLNPAGTECFAQDWAGPELGSWQDTIIVAYKGIPENESPVYILRSTDGGRSFSDSIRIGSSNWSRFPKVAIAPNGKSYIGFMKFEPQWKEPHYAVSKAVNASSNFEIEVSTATNIDGEACDCCTAEIIAKNNEVSLLFRNNDTNLRNIWASKSSNSGSSFDVQKEIDHTNWNITGCPSTGPSAIYYGDSVAFTWMSAASGVNTIMVGSAHGSSLETGQNVAIASGNSNENFPVIAGSNSLVALVWQESGMIKFRFSTDGINGLKDANTLDVNSAGIGTNPHMTFGGNAFHITWQDNLNRAVNYRSVAVKGSLQIAELNPKTKPISPNPFNDVIRIETNHGGLIKIMDQFGRIVLTSETEGGITALNLSWLSKASYTLTYTYNGETRRQKIIKVN